MGGFFFNILRIIDVLELTYAIKIVSYFPSFCSSEIKSYFLTFFCCLEVRKWNLKKIENLDRQFSLLERANDTYLKYFSFISPLFLSSFLISSLFL